MKQMRNRTAGATDRRRRPEQGFTVIQMVVTLAVATVLMSFSVMGIARVRGTMRLSSASDELTQYLERARQDSIRRHAEATGGALPSADEMASVTFLSATSYTVRMDFDSDGMIEEDELRTVTLPEDVTLPAALYAGAGTTITFDWRGRPSGELNVALSSDYGSKTVSVSESGSVSAFDTSDVEGFELSAMPSPGDVPKSEFPSAGSEEGSDEGDTGKDKKNDDPPTDTGGGTTDPGTGNGKDKKNDNDPPTGPTPAPTADPAPTAAPTPAPDPGPGDGKDKKNDPPTGPTPAPTAEPTPSTPPPGPTPSATPKATPSATPTPPPACKKNEKPADTGCVCSSGLDKFGRCK